jgi:drug/metabolite transporter (DMT)-like permease
MSRRGVVLFSAMCVIWGLPYLMIRIAVNHGVDPATLVFLRTAPAAIILVPIALRSGALRAVRGRLGWIVIYSVVHFGVPWLFMSAAEQHLSSSVTGMLVASVPLLAVVAAKLLGRDEHFGAARLSGIALGAVGVGLLVGFSLKGSDGMWIAAMGIVLLGYTFGPIIISTKLTGIPGLGVVATAVTVVALAYSPYAATHLPSHVSLEVLGAILVLALVCTAAAFLVFFELVHEVGPSRSLVVTYVNTAVAVVLGVSVLSERLTAGIVIGFPLIILGSYLATSRRPPVNEVPPPGELSQPRSWRRAWRQAIPR